MTCFRLASIACFLIGLISGAAGQAWPQTRAEKSNYAETSHYSDVVAFLHQLQYAGAPISVQPVGTSTLGKEMVLAIASFPPVSSPAEALRLGKPIVYIQANIHAGEVEGKEAALAILRRLSQDGPNGILGKIVLLVNPIYNIDGNEKFGPVEENRPEQDGPGMVGVRPNGQGLDLNRDAIKAESPETRGVLEHVYNTWDPDVMMDLHTTDGTRHGWELTYAPPMNPNTDPDVMHFSRDVLLPTIRRELQQKFGMLTFDYGNVESRRGQKGRAWYTYGQEGRYCTHYVGLRGRISILSEATTFIPFKDRVVGTDRFVSAILEYVAAHAKQVMDLTRKADARVVAWGLDASKAPELGVRFDFDLRGEETVLLEHPLPAGSPTPFGRPKQLDKVKMPIYDRFKVTRTAKFPAGYLLPAEAKEAVALLVRHGIVVEKLLEPWQGEAESFAIEKLTAARAFQGHRMVDLEGKFAKGPATANKGAYLVRTAQPLGGLVFHLLEPESLDGVAAWGFLSSSLIAGQPYPIRKVYDQVRVATEREVQKS
jgi:hypothetical protein